MGKGASNVINLFLIVGDGLVLSRKRRGEEVKRVEKRGEYTEEIAWVEKRILDLKRFHIYGKLLLIVPPRVSPLSLTLLHSASSFSLPN